MIRRVLGPLVESEAHDMTGIPHHGNVARRQHGMIQQGTNSLPIRC